MQKFIFSTLLVLFAVVIPVSADSFKDDDPSSTDESSEIIVRTYYSSIRVKNGNGKTLYIYSLTGECKENIFIDSNDKTVSLNLPRCIYIVKIGDKASKIVIK